MPSAGVVLHVMARSGIRIPLTTDRSARGLEAVWDILITLYMCAMFVFSHLKQHRKPYYAPRCFVLMHAYLFNLLNVMVYV
jgi:hypothetical protein